jgi:hypothetical protein
MKIICNDKEQIEKRKKKKREWGRGDKPTARPTKSSNFSSLFCKTVEYK